MEEKKQEKIGEKKDISWGKPESAPTYSNPTPW